MINLYFFEREYDYNEKRIKYYIIFDYIPDIIWL